MSVIVTKDPSRWALLALYSAALVALAVALLRVGDVQGAPVVVPVAGAALAACVRSLAAIIWAPLVWNVVPRLEFRHRLLSHALGSRSLAHYTFAAYIVAFSSLREKFFFDAIDAAPVWKAHAAEALHVVGTALLAGGALLSAAGFWHLRVRFTYMGEYFGYRMPALITTFPFNCFPDPMYNGSVLMHFGYALRAASPTGFLLAAATGLSYWIAAKILEEYVSLLSVRRAQQFGARVQATDWMAFLTY